MPRHKNTKRKKPVIGKVVQERDSGKLTERMERKNKRGNSIQEIPQECNADIVMIYQTTYETNKQT